MIASDVGGVHELVRHGRTGLLVAPADDAAGYVSALREVAGGLVDTDALVANALTLLRRRHGWASFVRALAETPGYVADGRRAGERRRAA